MRPFDVVLLAVDVIENAHNKRSVGLRELYESILALSEKMPKMTNGRRENLMSAVALLHNLNFFVETRAEPPEVTITSEGKARVKKYARTPEGAEIMKHVKEIVR